ncbi:MAG: hypothetical protein PHP65_04490 [Bacilli bacterium]|nr:hypothetical protein [Bacilli bacterium]
MAKKNNKIIKILKFGNVGFKIFFSDGKAFFVEEIMKTDGNLYVNYLDFQVSFSHNNIFDYYKTLAKHVIDIAETDSDISKILFNLYKTTNQENELIANVNMKLGHLSNMKLGHSYLNNHSLVSFKR